MVQNVSGPEQLAGWEKDAIDPRPRVSSGWAELDLLLRRQSFGPGTFAILAGRMHTRKTAVMLNFIHNMAAAGVPVGLVGLDEGSYLYTAKLASVATSVSHVALDNLWASRGPGLSAMQQKYGALTQQFSMTKGYRPSLDELANWLEELSFRSIRPQVVFIDYLSLLERGKYSGKDTERIPRLCEELQVWTNAQGVVTIALHQVGRSDDSNTRRYHGHTPITPEQLMYGGEQQADIILGTYRPALDPVGNLSQDEAESQGITTDVWKSANDRVAAWQQDTMLQLIKNRPGVMLSPHGIRLRSVGLSQRMEVLPP